MNDGESPGPPEAENPRLVTEGSKNKDFRSVHTSHLVDLQAPQCFDPLLEAYFPFIERLHTRSGSGLISGHFLDVALKSYGFYRCTCDGLYRRSCWRAIHASLQWLSQRSRRN
jgi:hypothetical protein